MKAAEKATAGQEKLQWQTKKPRATDQKKNEENAFFLRNIMTDRSPGTDAKLCLSVKTSSAPGHYPHHLIPSFQLCSHEAAEKQELKC